MRKYTPLQELTKRELKLKSQVHHQEEKLINELRYVRDHAGSLLFSTVTSNLLSPLNDREGGSGYGNSLGKVVLGLTRVGGVVTKIAPLVFTFLLHNLLRWTGGRVGSLLGINKKR